jgi:hypothetical protein
MPVDTATASTPASPESDVTSWSCSSSTGVGAEAEPPSPPRRVMT